MGIYDQLEQLNTTSTTPPRTLVGVSDAPKSPLQVKQPSPTKKSQPINLTRKPTREVTQERELPREPSRDNSRNNPRALPSREEVQEFSFRLRDDLKVKVQAEVPHQWQDELEELARQLDVKKLELYRFILGEFLGKVRRKPSGKGVTGETVVIFKQGER
jgi:hypothetical protein